MSDYASAEEIARECRSALKPPPKLTISEWADQHFYLSAESAAEPGRWKTLPYQRGLLDAISDPAVTQISVMKSARVGFTKCMNAAIGYYMHHDPCSILVVQPNIEDAKGYSKEEIAPMLRDCPELQKIVFEDSEDRGPKDSGQTILHKNFPGGVLSMTGSNSGAGFRRISRRVVMFDEVDAYPPSAGDDGDPVALGIKRSEYFWNRKIIAGSTPLIEGASRITDLFKQGDQRRYHVPCPHCGHEAPLVWKGDHGHEMTWNAKDGSDAFFTCQRGGCVIEHKDKRSMVEAGKWIAGAPFTGHASFHVWAAYSYSPNATWAQLAAEFLEAKRKGPDTLRTFFNTALGETWKELGEAPDWEMLFARREGYAIGSVHPDVVTITAGVDVQKDRWVYEVVGWGLDRQSWSIESGVIPGDTSNQANWIALDELLARTYPVAAGGQMPIRKLAIDSGYNTNNAYLWARRHGMGRVMAVKGQATFRAIYGAPSKVDVTERGRRIARGAQLWPVGVDVAKSELYGWLRLSLPADGADFPPGYCHFPEYGQDFFKQITGEQLVSTRTRQGFTKYEWQVIPGRENHFLDARVYARAAAASIGLDRAAPQPPAPAPVAAPTRTPDSRPARVQGGGGWLKKRR